MYFEEKQYYNAATLYACYEICDMINHSLQINKDNQFGGKNIHLIKFRPIFGWPLNSKTN